MADDRRLRAALEGRGRHIKERHTAVAELTGLVDALRAKMKVQLA